VSSDKTAAGVAREVLSASGKRALNELLTEYNRDEQRFNHKRLGEARKHGETRWSKDCYIIPEDTTTEKVGDKVPGVGRLYDHAENNTLLGQNIIYVFYATTKQPVPSHFPLLRTARQQGCW
jgi:hypothetical protein